MIIDLKINVKKFENKDGIRYALSTFLENKDDTAGVNGVWYKVYPTNEFKAQVESAGIKLNRPFILKIDTDCIGYDVENKKLFIRADKPCNITFIKSDKPIEEKAKTPKFDEVFKCVTSEDTQVKKD